MLTSDRPISNTIITGGVGYLIKLFAYNFLTGMVVLTFGALIAAYLIIFGPEMPFLKYFSFILPIDKNGTGSINEGDLMRLFRFMTLIFFLVSIIGKQMLLSAKRFFLSTNENDTLDENEPPNQTIFSQIMRRFLINAFFITWAYLIVAVAFPFAKLSEGTTLPIIYMILAIFYVIAMASNALFVLIDSLSNYVLAKASIFA